MTFTHVECPFNYTFKAIALRYLTPAAGNLRLGSCGALSGSHYPDAVR